MICHLTHDKRHQIVVTYYSQITLRDYQSRFRVNNKQLNQNAQGQPQGQAHPDKSIGRYVLEAPVRPKDTLGMNF